MPPSLKRLIGAVIIVIFVIFYALIAALVGSRLAIDQPIWIQFIYFPVAGLLWIVPVGALIVWMYRKKAS
jgi:hypothetical protein